MDNIRLAVESDLSALVEMAKKMHDESPRFSGLEFSYVKTANTILAMIINEDGLVLVATHNGVPIGMFGGFVAEHLFGTDKLAADVGLYLMKEHRGGRAAIRMVRYFEDWAAERGAKDSVLGVSTEVHSDRTANLYEHLGYRPSGHLMRKEL